VNRSSRHSDRHAVAVIKWLFILAVVAALCWIILFFVRRTA